MRVKTALRLRSQPARLSCHARVSDPKHISTTDFAQQTLLYSDNHNEIAVRTISSRQRGANTLLLALFAVAMIVTAMVAILFGHKLGYQSGYYSQQSENQQAAINSEQATTELKDLRISNKVLTNQVATAKQELTISLNNLDELRQNQRDLAVESSQVNQLNELYADFISENGGLPLQVLGAKIEPLPENAFEYGFDIGMLSEKGSAQSLTATLTLQNNDDFIEVPLDPARFSIQGVVRIRGRFIMPTGFKPSQVKLTLKADDEEVEQLYDWTIGDMVDSMPLSLLDLPEPDQSPISNKSGEKIATTNKTAP